MSDTGIGIPKDKHSLIFERFAQVDHGVARLYGGTGLGLPIVKGLLELMGGNVWLESEPEKGSTFYFSFPYENTLLNEPHKPDIQEVQNQSFNNETVLIVEDDKYNADYMKEILYGSGLKIWHTLYGREAIDIVANQHVDIVLMDIRLPDIEGYEAIRQIKVIKPNLKIIAQTAYAAESDRQKALESGCVDFISKPVKADLLVSKLLMQLFVK